VIIAIYAVNFSLSLFEQVLKSGYIRLHFEHRSQKHKIKHEQSVVSSARPAALMRPSAAAVSRVVLLFMKTSAKVDNPADC